MMFGGSKWRGNLNGEDNPMGGGFSGGMGAMPNAPSGGLGAAPAWATGPYGGLGGSTKPYDPNSPEYQPGGVLGSPVGYDPRKAWGELTGAPQVSYGEDTPMYAGGSNNFDESTGQYRYGAPPNRKMPGLGNMWGDGQPQPGRDYAGGTPGFYGRPRDGGGDGTTNGWMQGPTGYKQYNNPPQMYQSPGGAWDDMQRLPGQEWRGYHGGPQRQFMQPRQNPWGFRNQRNLSNMWSMY